MLTLAFMIRRSGVRLATRLAITAAVTALLGGWLVGPLDAQSRLPRAPTFTVDPGWPTIPNDWVLGEVTSIDVDAQDHVWVLHRPKSIPEEQQAHAAPPVLEFDLEGRFLSSWGGPGDGYDWPEREHGIHVDDDGNVWITGNGGWPKAAPGTSTDDMILKFTRSGELIAQFGQQGASGGNDDTVNVHQPGDVFVHRPANELYVADGYGNNRLIVFDATTGAFKRMWGAFGNAPKAPAPRGRGAPPLDPETAPDFGLVHAVKVSNDGIVYVADRANRRVQLFTTEGRYLQQVIFEGETSPTPAGFSFSPDPEQRFLYVVESANARVAIFDRQTMTEIGTFGSRTAEPGGMDYAHHIAVDSRGNLYTAEIVNNRRAQKFVVSPPR